MEKIFHKGVCGILEHKSFDEIVIMVHGYSSHKNTVALEKAAKILDISSLRIDMDNKGELGKLTVTDYVKKVDIAVEFVKKEGYKKIDLMGTSSGGMICMASALKHDINKLFLRAPSSNYAKQCEYNKSEERMKEWKKKGFIIRKKKDGTEYKCYYTFYEDAKNYVMEDKVKNIKCPVMIIHGDKDEEIPLEHSEKLSFPNVKLHVIKGASHNLGVDGDWDEGFRIMKEFFYN
jgi:pimeloyl-ACP methyl ester carboxylesterase